jgi:hypothetical protein
MSSAGTIARASAIAMPDFRPIRAACLSAA